MCVCCTLAYTASPYRHTTPADVLPSPSAFSLSYTLMAHLRWVLSPSIVSPTARCFKIIGLLMSPLLQHEKEGKFSREEVCLKGLRMLTLSDKGGLRCCHLMGYLIPVQLL